MKTRYAKPVHDQGSVLATTIILCGILTLLMASYLSWVQTHHLSVSRAQAWNGAIVVAEAGVEEAMAQLNSGVTTNNLAVNNWTNLGSGKYLKGTSLGTSSYRVTIIATNANPVIVSAGTVPGPVSQPKLTRTVQVKTKSNGSLGLSGAMVVSTTVDFKGFNINTDSFNSTNLALFPGGLYNSANAQDHGDVVSNSGQTNAVNIGNGKVKGTVHTAPNGQVNVGSGGSVGDKNWVNSGKTGVEMTPVEHFVQDSNYEFPDATLPSKPFWLSPVPGSYKINGVTYKYLLNSSSPWKIGTLDGGVYVNGPGVLLQVTDGFALGKKDEIRITGSGDLTMYVSAQDANIGGNGIINDTGLAKKLKYYGLPSNNSLSFTANTAFVGEIYAPGANFTLSGGGNNTYDFVGQSITKSAFMNGHFNFHYDEGSSISPTTGGYVAISWDEL